MAINLNGTGSISGLSSISAPAISGVPTGSASAPAFSFTGDSNTGVYSPGADQVAISTGGSERLRITGTKIEVRNLGTTAEVDIGAAATGNNYAVINLIGDTTYPTFGTRLLRNNTGANANSELIHRGTGDLRIVAQDAGHITFNTSSLERLRVTSAGLVGVGTSAPWSSTTINGQGTAGDVTSARQLSVGFSSTYNTSFGYYQTGVAQPYAGVIQALDGGSGARLLLNPSGGNVGIGTTSPAATLHVSASSGEAVTRITNTGANSAWLVLVPGASGQAYIHNEANAPTIFTTNGTERARLDASGRLLVGTSSARGGFFGDGSVVPNIQLEVSGSRSRQAWITNANDGQAPEIIIAKSRGTSNGGVTVVQNNDELGMFSFQGTDGTDFTEAARIQAFVDGTPGNNDMPGRLVFSTTADGASSPTERFRIVSGGDLVVYNSGAIKPNTDNATLLGISGGRWSAVWAANGTIQTSDQRAKLDITSSTLGADFIKSLRPVSYRWIEGGKRDTGERDSDGNYIYESVPGERTHWGFIAQEVKQAVDAAGVDFGGWVLTDKDDPDSQQALRYDQFIAPLTKALQEALAEIDVLKAKVAALEAA